MNGTMTRDGPGTGSTGTATRQDPATLAVGGALLVLGLRRGSVVGTTAALAGGTLLYRGLRGSEPLIQTLGRLAPVNKAQTEAGAPADAPEIERSITVGKPADEIYRFWRHPEQFATIMRHVADISETGEGRSHWVVNNPLGQPLRWDSQIVDERPGEFLKWQSLPGATLPNEGEVRFRPAPGDRGTEVTLRMRFDPPGGAIGETVVTHLGMAPRLAASTALRRLKSLIETGEAPTLERNPSGRGSGDKI